MKDAFISFPALRGSQAGREFYATNWSLETLRRLAVFDATSLHAELRATRTRNPRAVAQLADYISSHPTNYVLSSLCLSVDDAVAFVLAPGSDTLGTIRIQVGARFVVNDGQHRHAALLEALRRQPALGKETIAITLYPDPGLERSGRMYADLNQTTKANTERGTPRRNQRTQASEITTALIAQSPPWRELLETKRSTLTTRSAKLFTATALNKATLHLLAARSFEQTTASNAPEAAMRFWGTCLAAMPAWQKVAARQQRASELRGSTLTVEGGFLSALAQAGARLMEKHPADWSEHMAKLQQIDWSEWEARFPGPMKNGQRSARPKDQLRQIAALIFETLESAR